MLGCLLVVLLIAQLTCCLKVDVKVVEAHSNIGQGQTGFRLGANKLVASRDPGLLCGHPGLNQLVGKCYVIEVSEYKYSVCPFNNITQHEVAVRWNAYRGILGVWSHWVYDPLYTTLTHGHYTDGESCTKDDKTIQRSAVLHHECGKQTRVTSVTEPDTCHYDITLESPLFCHTVFSDVYNALLPDEKENYLQATLEFNHNVLTEEGLKVARRDILEKKGCLSLRKEFKDLEECDKEFHDHKKKCDKLVETCNGSACEEKYDELLQKYSELRNILTENGLVFPEE